MTTVIKLREVPVEQLGKIIANSINNAMTAVQEHQRKLGVQRSCLSCENFIESNELCRKWQARPPARVIAFACEAYEDCDPIPF